MATRIVFLGSPEFALPGLRALASDPAFDVILVVTQPDRPAGRGRRLTAPPVAQVASDLGIDLFQPESLRAAEAVARVELAQPDVLIVIAYGELLRRAVLELAPHGALNVHPSLLPRYRGAAPIPAAILAGDDVTGTSIIKLVRRLDAGPIVAQQQLDIMSSDTTASLSNRLALQSAEMLPGVVLGWVSGQLTAWEQDDELATHTREWTRADARIDWSSPAIHIERLIRAANPWPLAWTTLDDASLAVHAGHVSDAAAEDPGRVRVWHGSVIVATGHGSLELVTVQPAGKRPIPAADWLRGLRRADVVLES